MRATAKISLIVSFFVLSKSKVHIIQKTSFHFCLLLAVGESQLTVFVQHNANKLLKCLMMKLKPYRRRKCRARSFSITFYLSD